MVIQVQIKGLKRVKKFFAELPIQLNKEILKVSNHFMINVQKFAKLMAPVDTGFLKDQIKVYRKGNEIILNTGEAYYAYYQEFGFTPHIIPIEYIKQHEIAPAIPGQFVRRPRGYVLVSRFKPFIFPALEKNLSNLPNMLSQGVKNAIQKARR